MKKVPALRVIRSAISQPNWETSETSRLKERARLERRAGDPRLRCGGRCVYQSLAQSAAPTRGIISVNEHGHERDQSSDQRVFHSFHSGLILQKSFNHFLVNPFLSGEL